MHEDDEIQELLDRVPEGRGAGKYLDQLSEGSREVLDEFERWLVEDDEKAKSTAAAYKGYCAKAAVELAKDPDYELDTDVKSAIGALRRFKLAMDAEAEGPPPSSLDELDDDSVADDIDRDGGVFDEREDDVPKSGDVE